MGGGSTSNAYSGVDPATPSYQSLSYGSALRGVGVVPVPGYASAVNYDPAATVNAGCVVAVEGCMQPSAVNYNPNATVRSATIYFIYTIYIQPECDRTLRHRRLPSACATFPSLRVESMATAMYKLRGPQVDSGSWYKV